VLRDVNGPAVLSEVVCPAVHGDVLGHAVF